MKRGLIISCLCLLMTPLTAQDFNDGETPYIVTFWFSACKYCIQEMDAMAEEFEEWNKQTSVRLYAVCTDSQRSVSQSKVLAAVHDWGSFKMVWDINGDIVRKFNVVSYPYVLLCAPDGKVLYSHLGYSPGDEASLWQALEQWYGGGN